MSLLLAIETSCDDTSAAVIRGVDVLSNVISSQTVHNQWGGIVPELASREHVVSVSVVVQQALQQAGVTMSEIDRIAVTNGPGLAGSLLVGTQFAKGLGLRYNIPVLPVHHIEAHLYTGHLENPKLGFPALCLIVSGGHTSIVLLESFTLYQVLGSTTDDAAGEAFDKVAKMLGLGYPGGPIVDTLARKHGENAIIQFPRGLMNDGTYNFSFSGLKTSVRQHISKLPKPLSEENIIAIAASAQAAIVDVLVRKTMSAAYEYNVQYVVIAGGVSANSALRKTIQECCAEKGLECVTPRGTYCVDNAAMIGFMASVRAEHDTKAILHNKYFGVSPKPLRASTV